MKTSHKILTAALGMGLVAGAIALRPTHVGPPQAYPDPQYTPGVVATTDFKELTAVSQCGTYSACHRKTTEGMKAQVCLEYINTCYKSVNEPDAGTSTVAVFAKQLIEIDHFCPLALGCADDVKNLWAEPEHLYATSTDGTVFDYGFHAKDAIELQMVLLMKAQKISPSDAQRCVLDDWVACYRKYITKTHLLGGLVPDTDPDDEQAALLPKGTRVCLLNPGDSLSDCKPYAYE